MSHVSPFFIYLVEYPENSTLHTIGCELVNSSWRLQRAVKSCPKSLVEETADFSVSLGLWQQPDPSNKKDSPSW